MMRAVMMLVSLSGLIVVLASIMIALTPGCRWQRVGVTALMGWAYWGLVIHALKVLGSPLPLEFWFPWWGPTGVGLAAWALWDVSKVLREYGAPTIGKAADIARDFSRVAPRSHVVHHARGVHREAVDRSTGTRGRDAGRVGPPLAGADQSRR